MQEQTLIREQIQIERRMDEIEQLEDCGINLSPKVEAEYNRLRIRWNELEEKSRQSH